MKKTISLFLVLMLLLTGCGAETAPETTAVPTTEAPVTEPVTEAPTTVPPTEEPTEAPTEEPTEAPTEAPTEPPAPTNPLTGETLEAEPETRVFAVTINNISSAMPMHGVSEADLFFEMYVNSYATRGLALYSDITRMSSVGSVRSLRYNFTDLCLIYDAVPVFASGSNQVLAHFDASGLKGLNTAYGGKYTYLDTDRINAGYASEHCLFAKGPECVAAAEKNGIRVTPEKDWNYGLQFTEEPLTEGENAAVVTIDLIHGQATKRTVMKYDAEQGRYLFNQFGKDMVDGDLEQNIYFDNVIVMFCSVYDQSVYHIANLIGNGEGYFAWGGKIVPIKWFREQESDPITFTYADGTPLELGVGNSYIALAPLTSKVVYE